MNFKKLIALDSPIRLSYHFLRAIIANVIYGFPSRKMVIIGVTGTNGKTTTTNIIAKGLREAGKKIFMFSTINYIINDKEYVNNYKMTSPDVFDLQRLLKEAKNAGCEYAVIETASHGILMNRVWGLEYDIAVLTNISQDHLDLHRTMDNYVKTKLRLFKSLLGFARKPGVKKTAIINNDTKYKDLFLSQTYDNHLTFGKDFSSNLRAENIKYEKDYTSFDVKIPGEILDIKTTFRGEFNIENILASIGVFSALGISPKTIKESIKKITGVPGRLEEVKSEEDFKVFVDYAHTADALEKVIETIKQIDGINRVITVFGATGDRDKTKRPIMGRILSELSDVVILTQDDDYSEKTENIINDVLPGIERKEGEDFWIITNREDAIRLALVTAKENDIVLVAGKGDEHVMVTNQGPIKWHDKTIIENILKDIDGNKIIG